MDDDSDSTASLTDSVLDDETSDAEQTDSDIDDYDDEEDGGVGGASKKPKAQSASRPAGPAVDLAAPDAAPVPPVVDKVIARRVVKDSEGNDVVEYLIKWKSLSYLHVTWQTRSELEAFHQNLKQRLDRFDIKLADLRLRGGGIEEDSLLDPQWQEVERIIAADSASDGPTVKYLVKWCGLSYAEATWETGEAINDPAAVAQFREFQQQPVVVSGRRRPAGAKFRKLTKSPTFGKDKSLTLKPYQLEGVNWLLFNWYQGRGSILADEMGLGKTAQSIAFLHNLATDKQLQLTGPFLVVAPLSTIPHWQSEVLTWTKFYPVVYHGNADARQVIRDFEFYSGSAPTTGKRKGGNTSRPFKFNVLITTYEMVMQDRSFLSGIDWQVLVVDEAHRLKNSQSRFNRDLSTFKRRHTLLLTGTPLQNNTEELWALLNFLAPTAFAESSKFLAKFGDLHQASQVAALHQLLRPYLLRRLKGDVKMKLPPKEETIIEVELTSMQKQYYRAIYERNTSFLVLGATSRKNVPNLTNVATELRKCCNHPYLNQGVEDQLTVGLTTPTELMDKLIMSSGKMVLVDKLLAKLRAGGHKVLIFSQMVRMLDLLTEYLQFRGYGYEMLDGRTRGTDRQASIERFTNPDNDRFVMLLSTRAGGLGINLTAADTVIIFDSDWNPQNDLQAQARVHRIGQQNAVKIYRLVTNKTYEMQMFHRASLKLGLDKAVIQQMRGGDKGTGADQGAREIDDLLKRGAYDVFREGQEGDEASKRFCEQDIDDILERSTKVVRYDEDNKPQPLEGGGAASGFSKATFVVEDGAEVDIDDPEFWTKAIGLAAPDEKDMMQAKGEYVPEEMDGVRKRRKVKLFGHVSTEGEIIAALGPDDTPEARRQYKETEKEVREQQKQAEKREKSKRRERDRAAKDARSIARQEQKRLKQIQREMQKQVSKQMRDNERRRRREAKEQERAEKKRLRDIAKAEKMREARESKLEPSPWTNAERNRFHRGIRTFGWGRWQAIREDSSLTRRAQAEVAVFARAYVGLAVELCDGSASDAPARLLAAIDSECPAVSHTHPLFQILHDDKWKTTLTQTAPRVVDRLWLLLHLRNHMAMAAASIYAARKLPYPSQELLQPSIYAFHLKYCSENAADNPSGTTESLDTVRFKDLLKQLVDQQQARVNASGAEGTALVPFDEPMVTSLAAAELADALPGGGKRSKPIKWLGVDPMDRFAAVTVFLRGYGRADDWKADLTLPWLVHARAQRWFTDQTAVVPPPPEPTPTMLDRHMTAIRSSDEDVASLPYTPESAVIHRYAKLFIEQSPLGSTPPSAEEQGVLRTMAVEMCANPILLPRLFRGLDAVGRPGGGAVEATGGLEAMQREVSLLSAQLVVAQAIKRKRESGGHPYQPTVRAKRQCQPDEAQGGVSVTGNGSGLGGATTDGASQLQAAGRDKTKPFRLNDAQTKRLMSLLECYGMPTDLDEDRTGNAADTGTPRSQATEPLCSWHDAAATVGIAASDHGALRRHVYEVMMPHLRALAVQPQKALQAQRGKRHIDPDTPLAEYTAVARNTARRLLDDMSMLVGVQDMARRGLLADDDRNSPLTRWLRSCNAGAAYLPAWWCPWVHDVALLQSVSKHGPYGWRKAQEDPSSALHPSQLTPHIVSALQEQAAHVDGGSFVAWAEAEAEASTTDDIACRRLHDIVSVFHPHRALAAGPSGAARKLRLSRVEAAELAAHEAFQTAVSEGLGWPDADSYTGQWDMVYRPSVGRTSSTVKANHGCSAVTCDEERWWWWAPTNRVVDTPNRDTGEDTVRASDHHWHRVNAQMCCAARGGGMKVSAKFDRPPAQSQVRCRPDAE